MSFSKMGKTLPNFLFDKGVAAIVANALRSAHQNDSSAVKRIARNTGVSTHAVKKWYEAKSAPEATHLLVLAVCYPEIQNKLNKMIDQARELWKNSDAEAAVAGAKNSRRTTKGDEIYTDKFVGINVRINRAIAAKLNARQLWVLGQMQMGRSVKPVQIADLWGVSLRTAERDVSEFKKLV